jgi:DeoR family transcriptional regulator, suf operon transcriptional repressor
MSRLDAVPRYSPGWQVINLVQRHGEMTVRELVDALGVTTTAIRLQVDRLVGDGILTATKRSRGRGRPSDVFSLTERGLNLVQPRYDLLLGHLIEELANDVGTDRVVQILSRVAARMADGFAGRVNGATVQERLANLVQLWQEQGIPVVVRYEGNHIILRQCGCPYYKVARGNRTICRMDARMMSQLVGRPVRQTQCLHDGHTACEFQISGNGDLSGLEHKPESLEPKPSLAGNRQGKAG